MTAPAPLEIRVGLPSPGGGLARAARVLGYRVMLSANSFFRRRDGEVVAVRRPGRDLRGLDACLDSAGYVAMRRYGGYGWTVEQYLRHVVRAFPWRWYSAPDYSCEPALAASVAAIRFRQAATVAAYHECARLAERYAMPRPVPVLQGWSPDDYHRCWDLLALPRDVAFIGIGSVCSRPVRGRDGLMAVLARLDRVLPAYVQVHLYGVKADGIVAVLSEAALDGRVRSVDSMAWDLAARVRFRTGRTIARRSRVMQRWYEQQAGRARAAASASQFGLFPITLAPPAHDGSEDPLLDEYLDLVAGGDLTLQSAMIHYERERVQVTATTPARARPVSPGKHADLPARTEQAILAFDRPGFRWQRAA